MFLQSDTAAFWGNVCTYFECFSLASPGGIGDRVSSVSIPGVNGSVASSANDNFNMDKAYKALTIFHL